MNEKFPKNKKILEEIYKNGTAPDPSELRGIYKITMLTGFLPDLSDFGHVKKFKHVKKFHHLSKVVGYNMFDYWFNWGYFKVYMKNKETIIDYDTKGNWLSRKIIDTIVTITPKQLYLGKFHYKIFGKPRFIGYFVMEKER